MKLGWANPQPLRQCPSTGLGRRPRAPLLHACCSATNNGSGAPQGGSPVDLPGGGVWLGAAGRQSHDVLYGSSYGFVIKREPRPRVGGEGLVRRMPPPKPVRQPVGAPRGGSLLVPWQRPAEAGLSLAGLGPAGWVIDTDFEIVETAGPIAPNTTCTGIVLVSVPGNEAEAEASAPISKHPRRTRRVSFTCNLCGTSNTKETNPHAWQRGSVFMRCEGCSAVHKARQHSEAAGLMRDNLKIFTEVKGPVFPPRNLRNSFLLQEVLDKISARRQREGESDDLLN